MALFRRRCWQPSVSHHPLGLETGLNEADKVFLIESEKHALAHARAVIVTSRSTAETLAADFAVPAGKITIAEPGVARAARADGSGASGDKRLHLLAVGSVIARKGYDLLIEALSRQTNRGWRLTIAGETRFQPDTYMRLRRQISAEGLERHVTFAGSVDEATLGTLYATADCFVMPSHYEGYGMALTEALARGLPVISSTGGALAITLPDGVGLRFAPGDVEGLSAHLETVLGDAALRKALSDQAWSSISSLPDWQDTTQTILDVLKEHAR
jgi:glycosyltransferase involved in cell wall biosynthesis